MGIEQPLVFHGDGFESAVSKNMPLLGAIIENRFFEDPYEEPYERASLSRAWDLNYSRRLGNGQMLPVYDSEYGCLELYVNIGGNGADYRKYYHGPEKNPANVRLAGPKEAYPSDAAMEAAGFTMLALDNKTPVQVTLPADFYGATFYNRTLPDNLTWWVGAGVIGYAEAFPDPIVGAANEWQDRLLEYDWPLAVQAYTTKAGQFSEGLNCRAGYRGVTIDGRDWMIFRFEQPIDSFQNPRIPVEIWLAPGDGSIAVLYGDWNVSHDPASWTQSDWVNHVQAISDDFLISGGLAEYLNITVEDPTRVYNERIGNVIIVDREVVSNFESLAVSVYRGPDEDPGICSYAYYIMASGAVGDGVAENWKKVDMYWPKIDPNTGDLMDPHSSWYNPLAR